jgi:S1-C subfamily serine protease
LGIRHEEVPEFFRNLFNLPSTGMLIRDVVEDSPAEEAGLLPLDLVTHINDHRIEGFLDLQSVLNIVRPGEEITIGLYREGIRMELQLVLGSRMS